MTMSEDEDRFPARRILAEDPKKKLYKVDWEGVNPDTGRAWSPTWEPYEYVSEVLIQEYEAKQARRSETGLHKASAAALRDFDIKRNRTQTPSEEEYISPVEAELDSWATRRLSSAQKGKQTRSKRKNEASGSSSSHRSSSRVSLSNNTSRRGSEPSLPSSKVSETSRGKRRRTSPEAPRPTSKKSRTNSLDNVDYSPEESNEEEDEDDEDDGPVVASRRKLSSSTSLFQNPSESPQKPVERLRAIPKSLQLKTPMVSVSRADYLESNDLAEELFSSEKMSKQSSALPPFARAVQATGDKPSKLTQKQQSNIGAREKFKRKQDSHRQSADGLPRPLAETSLPSFKRATNGSGMTSHEFFNEHKRRPSAPITSNEVEWALLAGDKKDSESHMGNESVSVIADSAPQEDHTLSITRSPEINGNGSAIEGLSVRQPWKKAHSPGARLAHANIEKPRMPVKVPEPEVFKSFLTATQASEDIQDFSSQQSVPESTSSEEVLRALTAPSHQADDDANAISLVEEDDVLPPLGQAVQDTLEAVPDQALVPGDLPEPATSFETAPTQTESASLQAISTSVIGVANEASNKHQTEDATLPAVESAVPVEEATRKQETETSLSAPGTLVLGPEETVETSTNEREARAKINKSMLLPNESTRQDLHIFLDAPTYYCFQQRALTKQTAWDFELESSENEQEQVSWHLLLDMVAGTWKLEKRVRKYTEMRSDGSGNDQIVSLYNDLLTAHTNLKKVNDAATLQIGELESSLAFMREQDRVKSKRIEELAMDKQRLENDILLLRQQVTLGVKQVELIWSAKEQRLKEDLDTTKKQLEHTKELIRNSNIETLRSQASEVHELKAREQARIANEQAEKQRQALRRSNLYSEFLTSTFAQPVADQASGEVKPAQALPITAATGVDGDSEDDEDFVGGSSDDSGDDSTDSYDSSDDAVPPAQAPVTVAPDMSGIQYPVLPASELVNAALASSEGILPGGLASISPAPVDFVTTAHVVTSVDTSGETTQVTTSASIAVPDAHDSAKDYSQQVSSSETRYIESDEILELDSGVLESQLAYPCSWGKASGNECRALFSSQKELYDHVVDEHATP